MHLSDTNYQEFSNQDQKEEDQDVMQSQTNGIDRGGDGGGPEREPLFQVGQSILVQKCGLTCTFIFTFFQSKE